MYWQGWYFDALSKLCNNMLWIEVNKNKNKRHKRQYTIFRIQPRDFDRLTTIITLCSTIYLYMYNLIIEKSFPWLGLYLKNSRLASTSALCLSCDFDLLGNLFLGGGENKTTDILIYKFSSNGNGSFSFHADVYFSPSQIPHLII